MSKSFESYIRNHRDALDKHEPDTERLWKGIEARMDARKQHADNTSAPVRMRVGKPAKVKRPLWRREGLYRWAASIAIAVGVGTGWNTFVPILMDVEPSVAVAQLPTTASGLPAEFANMESYYRDAIAKQRAQLVSYHDEGIRLDDQFSVDLDQLHADYERLQSELKVSDNAEAVIDAMVQNLNVQLEILQQQIRMLEKVKQAKQKPENDAVQI